MQMEVAFNAPQIRLAPNSPEQTTNDVFNAPLPYFQKNIAGSFRNSVKTK
jgi:hypothetical protein